MDGRVQEGLRILYPCPHCNSPVRDFSGSLVCDMCSGLTHLNCTDLPYEISAFVQTHGRSAIKFFCCNCISVANSLIERNRLNADISKRYEMLQHSFLDFTSVVHNKFSSLEASMKSVFELLRSQEIRRPPFSSAHYANDRAFFNILTGYPNGYAGPSSGYPVTTKWVPSEGPFRFQLFRGNDIISLKYFGLTISF